MTFILGIDTSGLSGSIALLGENELVEHRSLEQTGRRHAQTLIAEIAVMMTAHDIRPSDLGAISVVRGPGSFTGLRVGMTCAKTLSYALRAPLVTVDTFDVIAAQCPQDWQEVWIVEDAQRQELYVGEYQRLDRDAWELQGERQIVPMSNWLAARSEQDIIVGPGVGKIPAEATVPQIIRDTQINVPRAETVCRLAARRFAAKQFDDCWTAMPFYIRVSGAEEKAARTGK